MSLYRNQRVIAIIIEVTEGVDPLLKVDGSIDESKVAAATVAIEEFAQNVQDETIQRNRITPEQSGSSSISAMAHCKPAGKAFITMKGITAGDAADVPEHGIYLQCGGWELLSDATTKSHTFTLTSGQGKTATCYEIVNNTTRTKSLLTRSHRNRGNIKIMHEAGKPDMLDFSWIGTQPNTELPVEPQTTAFKKAYNLDREQELKFNNTWWRLVNLSDGDKLYGGGTLESPEFDGDLLSVELDCKRNPQARKGSRATGGIHGAINDMQQPTITIKLEVNDYDRVNLQTSCRLRHTFEFSFLGSQPGSPLNTRQGLGYLSIKSVKDREISDGLYIATCECELIYPADIDGTDYVAGERPFSTAEKGVDRGLLHAPADIPNGLFWYQYATAAPPS